MELEAALRFARDRTKGTLLTIREDGRPHATNVLYALDGDILRVSLTDSRVKTRNLRGDPRASMHVTDESFWQYAVLNGIAELTPPAERVDDDTVEALVLLYRRLSGEHPDWDEYRAAMVSDRRLVFSMKVTHAYGQLTG